jgi:hypothetical protein
LETPKKQYELINSKNIEATRYWVLLSQPLTQMLKNDFISNVIVLLLMVFFGVIVYLGLVFVIARSQILASYKLLRNV